MPLTDNLVLITLGALILLLLLVLSFVLYLSTRPEREPGARVVVPRMRPESLRSSFRQAVELIEGHIASRKQRYDVPWVLVFGDGGAPLGLDQAGIASTLGTDAAAAAATPGLSWHFFDQGVAIELDGASLGDPQAGPEAPERSFDEFLSLCRDYRPQRPFDGVVLTIPASLLVADEAESRPALVRLAQRASRRLWLAQNRFALRLAVHVVISGCEQVPGFAAFARSLPELMRGSMLGWVSPYDLAMGYQSDWTGQAITEVVSTLGEASAELFASGSTGSAEAESFFLLPARVERMQPLLQLYLDELMRPSAYHEPFFLRGLYFSGDASEAAQLQGADAAASVESDAALDDGPALSPARSRQPAFLRDVFEAKVFPEKGLTRPSATRTVSKPALGWGVRLAAVLLLGGWGVGLAVSGYTLYGQSRELQVLLNGLKRDASDPRAAATRDGAAVQRDRALALLQSMGQLEGDRLWSVFMPGSWPAADALPERLRVRLEQAFSDIAVTTLRRGLDSRANTLTGVAQDPATGELIAGAPCTSAAANAMATETTLNIDSLPEFTALTQFVAAVDQLGRARAAMHRLQDPGQPLVVADLSLLVREALGQELAAPSERSAALFRAKPSSGVAQTAPSAALVEAMTCRLRGLAGQWTTRAFEENDLLLSQRDLTMRLSGLLGDMPADGTGGTAGTLAAWRELLVAIKAQDQLLLRGQAAWTQRPSLLSYPAWDRLLTQVDAVALLGGEAATRALRDLAEQGFRRLITELAEQKSADELTALGWREKDGRFQPEAPLLALRDGLGLLLAQPYAVAGRGRDMPELGADGLIGWDLARLDQALVVADQRKRFQAELLGRFPEAVRPAIERLVNVNLAQAVSEQLANALIPGGRLLGGNFEPAALDAERGRLLRIQTLLVDLGGRREADALRRMLARDAGRRLRAVDDALQRSELYATRNRDFSAWNGERGPVLAALGMADASQLAAYLSQQHGRAEALVKEADAWLAVLGPGELSPVMTARWQALRTDLERHRLKNPNSSLIALEAFLTAMAGDVDGQNCAERVAGRGPLGRPGDYFGERHAQLAAALVQRCHELRSGAQQAQWQTFASLFNRSYAGRPPFAQPGWGSASPAVEADELPALLRAYDAALPAAGGAVAGAASAASMGRSNGTARSTQPPAVRRFVEQFERSRAFLSPLVPSEEGLASGHDVAVEFRVASALELEGNKVIDWSISMGSQQLGWREPARALRWEPGQAVSISLRFAKDGQATPRADERQPALRVDGKTATWQFSDAWALLSLLQRQRDADGGGRSDGRSDGRSQLLRLELPLTLAGEAGAPPGEGRARVFVRLTLSAAGKRAPLIWPGQIPLRAPDWDATTSASER